MKNRLTPFMWVALAAVLIAGIIIGKAALDRANQQEVSSVDATQAVTPSPSADPVGLAGAGETPDAETEQNTQTGQPETTESPEATSELVPTPEPTAATTPTVAPTPEPTATPTPVPTPTPTPLPLEGLKIGIDPGHQLHANSDKEQVAPGSKEKKAKASSGTAGRVSGTPEHVVNLEVSLKLRDALEAMGAQVKMTREIADVDISNIERAQMMNEWGADVVLRIHCNGVESSSANGIGLYVRKTGTKAEESLSYAETIIDYMVEETGAEKDGIFRRDTYSGLNWSEVPSILVEMGYLTNKREDELLNTPEYQDKLVKGMVEGIAACFDRTLSEDGQKAEGASIAPANPLADSSVGE